MPAVVKPLAVSMLRVRDHLREYTQSRAGRRFDDQMSLEDALSWQGKTFLTCTSLINWNFLPPPISFCCLRGGDCLDYCFSGSNQAKSLFYVI